MKKIEEILNSYYVQIEDSEIPQYNYYLGYEGKKYADALYYLNNIVGLQYVESIRIYTFKYESVDGHYQSVPLSRPELKILFREGEAVKLSDLVVLSELIKDATVQAKSLFDEDGGETWHLVITGYQD